MRGVLTTFLGMALRKLLIAMGCKAFDHEVTAQPIAKEAHGTAFRVRW
jgi:hypothetical protein